MSTRVSPDLPGAVTLCPRVPRREVCGRQTLRPHNKHHNDAPTGAGHEDGGLPVRKGEKGEEAMNKDEKPEPSKRKGMVTVKPRQLPGVKPRREATMNQKKPETERKEDDRERINEELEFLIEAEDKIPRKEEKRDYDLEQLVEECVDNAMAEFRRALPPEELEIYEKCYRLFKRSNSYAIRWYTSERIMQRFLNLKGVEK